MHATAAWPLFFIWNRLPRHLSKIQALRVIIYVMSNPNEVTQQSPVSEQPEEINSPPESGKPRKRLFWLRLVLLGWAVLIVVALLSGYSGYQIGRDDFVATQTASNALEIDSQYQLGLQDLASRECNRARQRFEWVLERSPNHTGAIDGLAAAIICMNATATPTPITPTPTPTITPTPDMRTVEEKFDQSNTAMEARDWDAAITSLLSLRKEDANYMAVEVDSMLYVAFRNRGVSRILNLGELEGGLYDLAQAELFGPLDSEANGYRSWARLYLIGVSFYSVNDWAQSAFYLGQVAPFAPNLRNGASGFAMDWYLESLENYVEQLAEAKEWCTAAEQLGILIQYAPDFDREQLLEKYKNRCADKDN